MKNAWHYSGDVNTLAYGGRFIRKVKENTYHVIEFFNNHEDEVKGPHYTISLREISTDPAQRWGNESLVTGALRSCGWKLSEGEYGVKAGSVWCESSGDIIAGPEDAGLVIAEAINGYLGSHFEMWDYHGENGWALIRKAKKDSRENL